MNNISYFYDYSQEDALARLANDILEERRAERLRRERRAERRRKEKVHYAVNTVLIVCIFLAGVAVGLCLGVL